MIVISLDIFPYRQVVSRDRTGVSAEKVISEYRNATVSITPRTHGHIESFFEGFEFEPPGLVNVTMWRTDGPDIPGGLAAVARKP